LRAALARGGELAEIAEVRLGPAVAAIDTASALKKSAARAQDLAWANVLAQDVKADAGIAKVRDDMWNALGRPRASTRVQQMFPGGLPKYTSGDPRRQPTMMQLLRSRILSTSGPQWTKAACDAWAATIEALRVPYQAAVDAHRPIEAAAMAADVGYRTAVRSAHAHLIAFKRQLGSLGLTEAQIHEIIPDASIPALSSA
jgi:hypothetical protein